MALVVEALDRCVLYGSVHSLDLTVGPRVLRFGGPMVDVVLCAGEFERVGPEEFTVCHGLFDQRHSRSPGTGRRELDAVVGEHRMDLIGNGCNQAQQELP